MLLISEWNRFFQSIYLKAVWDNYKDKELDQAFSVDNWKVYFFPQITALTRLVSLSALSVTFCRNLYPQFWPKYVLVKFWQSSSSCHFLTYFKQSMVFFNHFMTSFYLHKVYFLVLFKTPYPWTLLILYHIFSASFSLDSTYLGSF